MRHRRVLPSALVAGALLLGACGEEAEQASTQAPATTSSTTEASTTTTESRVVAVPIPTTTEAPPTSSAPTASTTVPPGGAPELCAAHAAFDHLESPQSGEATVEEVRGWATQWAQLGAQMLAVAPPEVFDEVEVLALAAQDLAQITYDSGDIGSIEAELDSLYSEYEADLDEATEVVESWRDRHCPGEGGPVGESIGG